MTVNDNEEDMLERILSYVDGETKIVQYGRLIMETFALMDFV